MKEAEEEELNFRKIILIIKEWTLYLISKWVIILIVGLLGGIIGVIDAYYQKWEYTATLSFAIEDEKSTGGLGGAMGLASQFGIDIGGGGGGSVFGGANLIELMKSRTLIEKVLLKPVLVDGKAISFAELYLDFNGWKKSWDKSEKLKNIHFYTEPDRSKFTLQQDSILGKIYESLIFLNLTVNQKDKKVSILYINLKTGNEIFSKFFTEALAKEVSDFYIETKSRKSRMNVAILEKQTDSIRTELNSAISSVAAANDNTYNLNAGLNVKRIPSIRRQVDVQANTAILTELVKNLEIARMTLLKETPLIQVIDKPILPLNKVKSSKFNQLVIGGILGGFFAIAFIVGKRWWKGMMLQGV